MNIFNLSLLKISTFEKGMEVTHMKYEKYEKKVIGTRQKNILICTKKR